MTKRSSFGNMVRRRLSDITNYAPQHKSQVFIEKLSSDAKEHMEHLLKERMALLKLIQEKDKIIHLSGAEIQNLRNCIQKMKQQNWSLAQSNNLMLAELNLSRERLKALQHEVACKEALLKAKSVQYKVQAEAIMEENELQEPEAIARKIEISEPATCQNANRGHRLSRSRSLGSSMMSHQGKEKEAEPSKSCLARRRQSASLRTKNEEPMDNLFEIDDALFPITAPSNTPTHEVSETPQSMNSMECARELQAEARRTSIGRPRRSAVQKVQSYKERSVKVKLRRSE